MKGKGKRGYLENDDDEDDDEEVNRFRYSSEGVQFVFQFPGVDEVEDLHPHEDVEEVSVVSGRPVLFFVEVLSVYHPIGVPISDFGVPLVKKMRPQEKNHAHHCYLVQELPNDVLRHFLITQQQFRDKAR